MRYPKFGREPNCRTLSCRTRSSYSRLPFIPKEISRLQLQSCMAMAASSLGTLLQASRSSINGSSLCLPLRLPSPSPKSLPVACRAEKSDQENLTMPTTAGTSRRFALYFLAGAATVLSSRVSPAEAAYGEAANIFAAPKKESGFVAVSGDGFKLEVPSKWNPSKEVEFPGTVLRYEDNFDSNSNVCVMVTPTDKKSINDYGPPEKFIENVAYLLGKQTYAGKTQSEGGFEPNAVATASILESSTSNINGKEYYNISMLTRTADGNEGGKHQIVVATVNDGKLYMLKAQAGDKRWFKGAKKFVEGAASSFSLA